MVTVTHHFVAGCPAAWAARSRARAASMGPNPMASPGWSARPRRVARGMVRLIFAAGRIGAGGRGRPARSRWAVEAPCCRRRVLIPFR